MTRLRVSRTCEAPRPAAIALAFLLAACPCAFALDPTLDVSQYAHMSWKIREGFTKGIILSVAQTPDGYLWLGTEFALVRFDGVRTVAWQPPRNQSLPSSEIDALLAARDGTLWIGTSKGLASWKDGKLTEYPQLAGQKIRKLLQDRDDTVWAGALTFPPPGKLCAIHSGSVQCFGEMAVWAMACSVCSKTTKAICGREENMGCGDGNRALPSSIRCQTQIRSSDSLEIEMAHS